MAQSQGMFDGLFAADFWEDRVYLGAKAFPAGYFFSAVSNLPAISEQDEVTLAAAGTRIATLLQHLQTGFLGPELAQQAWTDITSIRSIFAPLEPFCYAGWHEPDAQQQVVFETKTLKAISSYFVVKAKFVANNSMAVYFWKEPSPADIEQLAHGKALLTQLQNTLRFYSCLAADIAAAKEMAAQFTQQVDSLETRDDSHLIALALECFGEAQLPDSPAELGSMQPAVCYAARGKDAKAKRKIVARRMGFRRYLDFLLADFYEGLRCGQYPGQCGICGRYFLRTDARSQKFCDGLDPADAQQRTCRQVAAAKSRKLREDAKEFAIKQPCAQRLNTLRLHVIKGKITEEQAAKAKAYAQQLRERALADAAYAAGSYLQDISQAAVYEALGIQL